MPGQPKLRARNAERRRLLGVPYRGDLVDPQDPEALLQLYAEALGAARMLLRDARRQYKAVGKDWRFIDDHGGEQLRSEVTVLQTQIASVARILTDVIKAGLESKKVKLQEKQVELLVHAVLAAVEDPMLGLAPTQKVQLRDRIASNLLVHADEAERS